MSENGQEVPERYTVEVTVNIVNPDGGIGEVVYQSPLPHASTEYLAVHELADFMVGIGEITWYRSITKATATLRHPAWKETGVYRK